MNKKPPESKHKQRLETVEIKKNDPWDRSIEREPSKQTAEKEWQATNKEFRDQREARH